jgi:hypothetical protein
MSYGRLKMKVYPLTDAHLSELGMLRTGAQASLALATGLFGFGINVAKDIELAGTIPAESAVRWSTIQYGSLAISAVLFVLAFILFLMGHSKLSKIKKETSFDAS